MQQIQNIRKATGIGQLALAAFLGTTRQVLAKAEQGVCSLSTSNLLKLSRLQACLDYPAFDNNKKQLALTGESGYDKNHETECRYLASVLQRRLLSCESTFEKSMRLYQALCILAPADEPDELWIRKTKNKIIKKLDKCGSAACMRIRKRIYLLIAEADYISRFVNENQSNPENQ